MAATLLAFGLVNILSLETKTVLKANNGKRAESLLNQLPAFISRVPSGGQLLLINPPDPTPSYSVFLVHGFDVFSGARQIVPWVAGRNDFSVRIMDEEGISGMGFGPEVLPVTLQEGIIVDYPLR